MKPEEQEKFAASLARFDKWREEKSDIIGYILWECNPHANFILQCWQSRSKGAVIFQIWHNGNGFTPYYCDEKIEAVRDTKNVLRENKMTKVNTVQGYDFYIGKTKEGMKVFQITPEGQPKPPFGGYGSKWHILKVKGINFDAFNEAEWS